MKLEEYREWLKTNANYEEAKAYEVAKLILDYHTYNINTEYDVELYPRKIFQTDKERLEFDLVIKLEWTSNRHYKRLIGVEFKETDISKVVVQAIARRDFVDYMYIATRNVTIDPYDLFRMIDFGIGWVIWSENFVKMLFTSKFNRYGNVASFINYLAREAVENAVKELKKEEKTMNLFRFIGD